MRSRILLASYIVGAVVVASGIIPQHFQAQNTTGGNQVDNQAYFGKPWYTNGSKTDTSDLALQAAPGAGLSVYVTMAFCVNSSAATVQTATIKSATTVMAVVNCPPAAKYSDPTYFDPPLKMAPNAAITMQGTGSVTTTYLFAEGTVAR